MHGFLGMTLYRLLLPVLCVIAFPAWLVKMIRRGGFGSGLRERLSWYRAPLEYEPCGAVHLHAVSVGENMLALKLLRAWRKLDPGQVFVLATGTSTGHAVALAGAPEGTRVVYAPLDFRWMVARYLSRFEPSRIVLVEGEAWPNLVFACHGRGIPVHLVNARVSPRSGRRYRKFAQWIRPVFSKLSGVAVQEKEDAGVWEAMGVPRERIHLTGSVKFDPGSGPRPGMRREFAEMLEPFGSGRPVVMLASSHEGEEALIAPLIREAVPEARIVVVPRHAERRAEVKMDLERADFEVVLRSAFHAPEDRDRACLVIDSTGELRDWTAHADLVIIGKSFLGTGGQNPCEAVIAGKPVIFGPHMENFEPLASRLVENGGCVRVAGADQLPGALRAWIDHQETAVTGAAASAAVLASHEGATDRTVAWLRDSAQG